MIAAIKKFRTGALAAIAAVLMLAAPIDAKIDLVTLPNRDTTQLTIYNSEDLTLVRETRTLSFSKGENQIQFSWANTLIDPTSLHLDLLGAKGLTLLDAVYPANTRDLVLWIIESEEEQSTPVEITYFSSGLTWSSEYTIKANAEETEFLLQQFTTVRNNSGEDFDNAITRVVVGEVNLLEMIAELARRGIHVGQDDRRQFGMAMMAKAEMRDTGRALPAPASAPAGGLMEMDAAKEIVKKAVSEYFLYAVEGKETIENGWGKRLPNPICEGVKFDLSYEIDPSKYGDQVVKFYKLRNDKKHELGETPLPEGVYYVYAANERDGLAFQGSTHHKYAPVGEKIELNLGSDGLVLYEARTVSESRRNFDFNSAGNIIGYEVVRELEFEIRNSRSREIPLKMTQFFYGDITIDQSSDSYERVDKETLRWELKVPAQEKKVISLRTVERTGSLAKSN